MDQNTVLNKIAMQIVRDGKSRIIPLHSTKYCLYAPFTFYENELSLQTPYSFEQHQDIDKIESMTNYVTDEFKNKKEISDMGMIHLGCYDNNLYIIDGHHRFTSLSTFFANYKRQRNDYYLLSTIYMIDNPIEIITIAKRMNSNHTKVDYLVLHEDDEHSNVDKMDYIEMKIREKYSKYESTNENCRTPKFCMKTLKEYIVDKFKNMNGIRIIKEIEDMNTNLGVEYRQHDAPFYQEVNDIIKDNENLSPFYLSKELSGYKNLKNMEEKEGRIKISLYQRRAIWNRYFEDETNIGKCAICSFSLKMSQFHVGHIRSVQSSRNESAGAGNVDTVSVNSIENMTVLCSACNTSLGPKNVFDAIIENGLTNSFMYDEARRYHEQKRQEEEERDRVLKTEENKGKRMKKKKEDTNETKEESSD